MPSESNARRGGPRRGAGRPAGHETARQYFAVSWLVQICRWSTRDAALAVALAEDERFARGTKGFDISEVRRAISRMPATSEPGATFRRRAKAIQTNYETMLRTHRARELPGGGVSAEDPRNWGPGPWDEAGSLPGQCEECGKTLVAPIVRVHELSMRRQVVGWACAEHEEGLLERVPRPAEWSRLEPEPKPPPEPLDPLKPRRRRRPVSYEENESRGEKKGALETYRGDRDVDSERRRPPGEIADSPSAEDQESADRRIDGFFKQRRRHRSVGRQP